MNNKPKLKDLIITDIEDEENLEVESLTFGVLDENDDMEITMKTRAGSSHKIWIGIKQMNQINNHTYKNIKNAKERKRSQTKV